MRHLARTVVSCVVLGGVAWMVGCGGATFSEAADSGEPETGKADSTPGFDAGRDAHVMDGARGDSARRDAPSFDAPTPDARPPTDAQPPKDAGADAAPWSPVCPAKAPALGMDCPMEGIICEYGPLQYDIACDNALQCQSGKWTKFNTFMSCVPDGPNPSSCPAALLDIAQGQGCAAVGTTCAYPEGVCTCEVQFGGPPILDSGSNARWTCNPGQGCPMPRPRVGSPCHGATIYCNYETCGYSQACQNGVWQGQDEVCGL